MKSNHVQWHLYLHAAPDSPRDSESTRVRGRLVERMKLEPSDQEQELGVGFEEFIEGLQRLEGCYVEWDGSFVWRPLGADGPWIEGNAFDGATRLQYVELKTHGPVRTLTKLLELLNWPKQPLIAQLVTEGVYVDATTALRLLEESSPSQ